MKYIVLSGASGGMGLATTKRLTDNGYFVFGLDNKEPNQSFNNYEFIKTDLRDSKQVENACKRILGVANELEAIVNMAGVSGTDSLIEISEEDFIDIFNNNVFGMYRLNKALARSLKEKGKIIIISSELGPLDPLPFIGLYAITKATVEKYAYSLRMELQLINKQVVVIRPGAVDTPMLDSSKECIDKFTSETELYSYTAYKFKSVTESVQSKKIPADKIGRLVFKILRKKKPKYTYKINRNFGLLVLNSLPQRLQNWIIKKILKSKQR